MKQSRQLYKVVLFVIALVGIIGCEPDKVLYEVKPSKAKIVRTSFEKEALFLKWSVKQIPEEEIAAYGISYGKGDRTIEKQFVVSKNTLKTGYRIGKLEEGKKYWAKVRAIYGKFTGAWSDKVEGVTGKPLPPEDFTVKKNTKEKKWYVELNWKQNSANEKLNIAWYKWTCWDEADANKKAEGETKGYEYQANTESTLTTNKKGSFTCSIRAETDKGVKSEVLEKAVAFDDIERPALSSTSEPWGTAITFPKSVDHTYRLKAGTSEFVSLDTGGDRASISATQPVSGVVVVAQRKGYKGSAESAEIEFTKQAGTKLSFPSPTETRTTGEGTFTESTRNYEFSISAVREIGIRDLRPISYNATEGTIDTAGTKFTISVQAIVRLHEKGETITITATKTENEKYLEQTASYTLTITPLWPTNVVKLTFPQDTYRYNSSGVVFRYEPYHDYSLQDDKGGLIKLLRRNTEFGSFGSIEATAPVRNVILKVTHTILGDSVDSDTINFR